MKRSRLIYITLLIIGFACIILAARQHSKDALDRATAPLADLKDHG